MKQYYITGITGFKYFIAVSQLEYHGSLHPDEHKFLIKNAIRTARHRNSNYDKTFIQVRIEVMREKNHNTVYYKMKKLHFRNTFKNSFEITEKP